MQLFSGNKNKVIIPREEVVEFIKDNPGCGLRERSYWFEFGEDGDIVDEDVPQQDNGAGRDLLAEMAREFLEGSRSDSLEDSKSGKPIVVFLDDDVNNILFYIPPSGMSEEEIVGIVSKVKVDCNYEYSAIDEALSNLGFVSPKPLHINIDTLVPTESLAP